MPPSIQERAEGLAALRVRATIATSAMYVLIGKEQPVQEVRFQVVNKGRSTYHVVERSTGKVMGLCFTWKAAIIRAQVLEARADGKKINIEGWLQ
jgi:Mg2+/Co2+ transporter CorC